MHLGKMRSEWVGPYSNMMCVFIRRENLNRYRDPEGEHHIMTEAEMRVMQLQAKKKQGLTTTKSQEEARKDST